MDRIRQQSWRHAESKNYKDGEQKVPLEIKSMDRESSRKKSDQKEEWRLWENADCSL